MTIHKIDWKSAPEWARFYSIDKDGVEHWWSHRPLLNHRFTWWLFNWTMPVSQTQRVRLPPEEYGFDWKDTLIERPKTMNAPQSTTESMLVEIKAKTGDALLHPSGDGWVCQCGDEQPYSEREDFKIYPSPYEAVLRAWERIWLDETSEDA